MLLQVNIENLPEAGALLAHMEQTVLSMHGDVVKFWLPFPIPLVPNKHYMIGAFIHAGVSPVWAACAAWAALAALHDRTAGCSFHHGKWHPCHLQGCAGPLTMR